MAPPLPSAPPIPGPRTPQATRVRVYSGDGAGWRSVRSAAASLARLLPPPYAVDAIGSAELLRGGWEPSTALLVLPGGADLPYARRLNGPEGNGRIRAFLAERGGGVLGLCAGAYYCCARVEFQAGAPPPGAPPGARPLAPPVAGDRELAFFPGVGRGAAFPGFDYATEGGAVAAPLAFRVPAAAAREAGGGGSGGGGARREKAAATTTPAITSTWIEARDYCNGGPFFVPYGPAPVGAADSGGEGGGRRAPNDDVDDDDDPWPLERDPRFEVLARYGSVRHPRAGERAIAAPAPGAAAEAAAAAAEATAAAAQAEGPAACPARGPLAAVRVAVGAGCAVLCATHPELSADWLDPLGGSHEHEHRGEAEKRAAAAAAGAAAVAAAESGSESDGKARAAAAAVAATAAAAPPSALLKQQQQQRRRREGDEAGEEQDDKAPPPPSALAAHTAALRVELEACRAARELFLAVLVYEALRR